MTWRPWARNRPIQEDPITPVPTTPTVRMDMVLRDCDADKGKFGWNGSE